MFTDPTPITPHIWDDPTKEYATCAACGLRWNTSGRGIPTTGEYAGCPATNDFKVGTILSVRAWWASNAPIRARIHSIFPNREYVTVIPMEGNPHTRMVKMDAILKG